MVFSLGGSRFGKVIVHGRLTCFQGEDRHVKKVRVYSTHMDQSLHDALFDLIGLINR